jgi:large subunit ribosomal protein L10
MGGAQGHATTLEGKKAVVGRVKELLDSSEMVFSIPAGSMTVAQTQTLRRSLPEGTTMSTIKNKLMLRALEGTEYESAASLVKGPNTWFFIQEDISGTIKAFSAFTKAESKQESHPILGGVIEGEVYDSAGVEAIGKLPSKLELYAKIAGSIKAVPTKVARVIKAPNSKLARAIKLAGETKE